MGNILKVSFGANRQAKTRPLWQYDYGQKLVLYGVDLPYTYEVHFSKSQESGTAITVLGDANGVEIPNDLLQNTGNVYAWLYLHVDGYDGETVYRIEIPVKPRPHAEDIIPPEQQTAIEQAVIALNDAIGRAEESADSAGESAERAEENAELAKGSADSAEESERNARLYKEDAERFADASEQSAVDSAESEANAAESESRAEQFALNAYRDAERAEQAAAASGYLFFHIDENGDLILERTTNTQVDFSLVDGDLILQEAT